MTSLLLTVAIAIAGQSGAASSKFQDSSSFSRSRGERDTRGYHQYQTQISELLKREAQAKAADDGEPVNAERAAAIRAMCDLHGQIVGDPRYSTSDTLKQYRGRLWSRLTKIKAELKHDLARDEAGAASLEDAAALEQADAASVAAADSLATSLSLLDQSQGGPGTLLARGGRAVEESNGRALVELIERTINPAFWDVVGGPGTIMYYAPLQCLVVRATSEVHGRVGGVIGDLRKAGE